MMPIVSRKIRSSARGEDCTVNIAGVCNYSPDTVVFAHLAHDGGTMGGKCTDLAGAYCCSVCHNAIDRRSWSQELEDRRDWYLRRANIRTLERLAELGIWRVA